MSLGTFNLQVRFEKYIGSLNGNSCESIFLNIIGGRGDWTTEGCTILQSLESMVECSCNHLTNFAILVVGVNIDKSKYTVADS